MGPSQTDLTEEGFELAAELGPEVCALDISSGSYNGKTDKKADGVKVPSMLEGLLFLWCCRLGRRQRAHARVAESTCQRQIERVSD